MSVTRVWPIFLLAIACTSARDEADGAYCVWSMVMGYEQPSYGKPFSTDAVALSTSFVAVSASTSSSGSVRVARPHWTVAVPR